LKTIVIIPTYNERKNIEKLLKAIFDLPIDNLEVLVVDDSSPDGTSDIVNKNAQQNPRLHLLKRAEKKGLGTAYVAGFRFSLEHDFDRIIEMDADFSHDPKDITRLIEASGQFDVTIGSRYIQGVNVVNWPLRRLLLSMGASLYTRLVTGLPVRDCTAGFVCYRRQVLESINLDHVKSDGYSFQIEMKFKAWKKGFTLGEIPIIFIDRRWGESKMSKKIVQEAYWMVWRLKLLSLFGKLE